MNIEIQSAYFSGLSVGRGSIGSSHLSTWRWKLTPPNKTRLQALQSCAIAAEQSSWPSASEGKRQGSPPGCSCWKSLVIGREASGVTKVLTAVVGNDKWFSTGLGFASATWFTEAFNIVTKNRRYDIMEWVNPSVVHCRVFCRLLGWNIALPFGSQLEAPEGYKNVDDLKLVDRTGVNYTHWENTWKSTTTPL